MLSSYYPREYNWAAVNKLLNHRRERRSERDRNRDRQRKRGWQGTDDRGRTEIPSEAEVKREELFLFDFCKTIEKIMIIHGMHLVSVFGQ